MANKILGGALALAVSADPGAASAAPVAAPVADSIESVQTQVVNSTSEEGVIKQDGKGKLVLHRPNGSTQGLVTVPADTCSNGGGTTYTHEGKVVAIVNGKAVDCGALTIDQRKEMAADDRGSDRDGNKVENTGGDKVEDEGEDTEVNTTPVNEENTGVIDPNELV